MDINRNRLQWSIHSFILMIIIISSVFASFTGVSFGAYSKAPPSPSGPGVNDPNLAVEKITDDLSTPTSMAFLGPGEMLVTEKNTGRVVHVVNGEVQDVPVLDVQVATKIERGLLGIAVSKNNVGNTHVFLFYTESGGGNDGDDVTAEVEPLGNRLYRYDYVNGKLVNPMLLLDLPANPVNINRTDHNGGKVIIGPDNNVYTVIGEVGGHRTQAQNIFDGPPADGTGGVLRITQDGQVVEPIFGPDLPLSIYYAIGIRNSFGIDFDPVTGIMWDTENGPDEGDEINMVEPGFNSGWALIQGDASTGVLGPEASEADLIAFENSVYQEPAFSWEFPIGITDAKFLNSDKLGKQYENNLFAGDINNGHLYRFTLNEERDAIELLNGTYSGDLDALSDNEVDETMETSPIIFGQGFGGITDLDVGPDGYLYVLTFQGDLYRVLPKSASLPTPNTPVTAASVSPAAPTSGQQPPASTSANAVTARIVGIEGDESYDPNPIEISMGQTITWLNGDTISHTVTSGFADDPNEGALFDSDAIISGHAYSKTFEEPGTYEYYCIYHPDMVGEIVVE
ncbi:MAG: PQQ-dependent sugar dehydrogenase [Thermoproteota archaeon]|nr:PQQ-dependent sugar dehydrogenase [Thermoproteota archaeon]